MRCERLQHLVEPKLEGGSQRSSETGVSDWPVALLLHHAGERGGELGQPGGEGGREDKGGESRMAIKFE